MSEFFLLYPVWFQRFQAAPAVSQVVDANQHWKVLIRKQGRYGLFQIALDWDKLPKTIKFLLSKNSVNVGMMSAASVKAVADNVFIGSNVQQVQVDDGDLQAGIVGLVHSERQE